MANFRAIETVSQVLLRVLTDRHDPGDFEGQRLQFKIFQGDDFRQNTLDMGVSLYLYRVTVGSSNRSSSGGGPGGSSQGPVPASVNLHYLVTIWAHSTLMQHRIAGWLVRTLEDSPVVPAGILHEARPDVFGENETIRVGPQELPNEDLFRIWNGLGTDYRLSLPYLVRGVQIESDENVASRQKMGERLRNAIGR